MAKVFFTHEASPVGQQLQHGILLRGAVRLVRKALSGGLGHNIHHQLVDAPELGPVKAPLQGKDGQFLRESVCLPQVLELI